MKIQKFHHVAYRCTDAKQTVEWYAKYLNMDFILAIAEDEVPSTKEPDPYMHIFLDAGGGNVLAFFELPTRPPMGRDPNTPAWTQHLALEVASMDDLLAAKERLEADGIGVIGPIKRGFHTQIACAWGDSLADTACINCIRSGIGAVVSASITATA